MESKKITKILCIIYLLFLTWIILFKMSTSLEELPHIRNINLIPFGESVIANGRISFAEILDNVVAFVPFGIFTGILLEKSAFWKRVAPIFGVSFLYEALQYVFGIGATDITDLLMNTLGGIAGAGIFLFLHKILGEKAGKILNILCLVGAGLLILLVSILVLGNL
ncbi:MAG: VanZ family protein [Oliverpabstia sp.]|nr:VanZ family protein [Oliverpabstia sp.]